MNSKNEVDVKNTEFKELKKYLYKSINSTGWLTSKLISGVEVFRARPNEGNFQAFKKESEISTNLDSSEYNRASSPYNPIFYGSLKSEIIDYGMITCAAEIIGVHKNPNIEKFNNTYITTGKWIVEKPITVLVIAYDNDMSNQNEVYKNSYQQFQSMLNDYSSYKMNIGFNKFISKQFSSKITNSIDYKLTAAFSEVFFEKGIEGIVFPSIATEYNSMNIALKHDAVINNLRLDKVLMSKIYVVNKDIIGDNNLMSDNIYNGNIEWKEVESKYTISNYEKKRLGIY